MTLRLWTEGSILATAMTDQRTIILLLLLFIGILSSCGQEKKTPDPKTTKPTVLRRCNYEHPKSEKVYRELIAANELALGAEHPDTLKNRNNLAFALSAQGKWAEAELEFRAVLAIRERVFGPEHPDTIICQSDLASVLNAQDKYAEAEKEFHTVLPFLERVRGPEDLYTLMIRNELAIALQAQGKYAKAEKEFRAMLPFQERALGAEHIYTLRIYESLASCLENQKKLKEALEFAQIAEKGWTKIWGAEQPESKNAATIRERIEAELKKQ